MASKTGLILANGESYVYSYEFKLLALPQQMYLTGIRLDPVYNTASAGDSHMLIEDIRLIHGQSTESFCPETMSSIRLPKLQFSWN